MTGLKLTDKADLGVFYDADSPRYLATRQHVLDVITRDAFIAFYKNCQSIGFESDGFAIGGIIFDGKAAHIAVLPAYHGRWALLLRRSLTWLFSLKSEILVEVEVENVKCIAFMERNGWKKQRIENGEITYLMTQKAYPTRQDRT